MACDVTVEAECKRLVEAAVDRWDRLDFLDNNVGIGSRVVDEKVEEYRGVMQVNVEMFLLSKHAIPAMKETSPRWLSPPQTACCHGIYNRPKSFRIIINRCEMLSGRAANLRIAGSQCIT
jgi:NAD(P)-dependent dehydrogenase (short-subunit alcohol dehydrogenase family)